MVYNCDNTNKTGQALHEFLCEREAGRLQSAHSKFTGCHMLSAFLPTMLQQGSLMDGRIVRRREKDFVAWWCADSTASCCGWPTETTRFGSSSYSSAGNTTQGQRNRSSAKLEIAQVRKKYYAWQIIGIIKTNWLSMLFNDTSAQFMQL